MIDMVEFQSLPVLFTISLSLMYVGECRITKVKRVVGGAPLEPGQWPFLVSLHFKPDNLFKRTTRQRHFCTGTLVRPQWVLTAGHCFDGEIWAGVERKKNWVVMLGKHNQYRHEDTEQKHRIKKIFQHPNYTAQPLLQDLTLLKLKHPANLTSHVQTIALDREGKCTGVDTRVSVAGWGQIAFRPSGWSMNIPLWTNLTIIEKEQCIGGYANVPADDPFKAYFAPEEDSILCAGSTTGGKDACSGDSGGPLACYYDNAWHEAAVVATGYKCGRREYPGLYTGLASYIRWMDDIMDNN